jgi:hypothetical protein|tara:strand:- start:3385 stop:4980 length:1596 start_codon:yes stop_codon:yes gene_type:complete
MAQQTINIGTTANDGTGDPLRTAFDKINDNFSELYGTTAEANDLLEDTTPQLGGNLDVNNKSITSGITNGNITVSANGTGTIELQSNTNVTGNLTASGNIIANGNINLGNAAGDNIQVTGKFEADNVQIDGSTITSIVTNGNLNVNGNGTGHVAINNLLVDSEIRIKDNKITTSTSNANLQLDANGTGSVEVIAPMVFTGAITHTGDLGITGNTTQTGNVNQTGTLQVTGVAEIDNVQINGSTITNIDTNGSLTLAGNGSGNVVINDVDIGGGAIDGTTIGAASASTGAFTTLSGASLSVTGSSTLDGVTINDNVITSAETNANLQLQGQGTGKVEILDELTGTFDTSQTGNHVITGQANIDYVRIKDNKITTNASNADLEISANGTGTVDVQNAMTTIGQTITGTATVNGQLNADNIRIDGNVISATSGSITLTAAAGQNIVATSLLTAGEIQANVGEFPVLRTDKLQSDITNGDIQVDTQGTGVVDFRTATQTTVGSAGGANALPGQPTGYLEVKINGTARVIPFYDKS